MKPVFFVVSLIVLILSCTDQAEPVAKEKERLPKTFANYQVWAEEGRDEVIIRLQYRRGGEEGEPVALQQPVSIQLDGEKLTADSTQFMGPFYEVSKPLEEFRGTHTLLFTDEAKNEHRQEFVFQPFSLANELPQSIKKKPFRIPLHNFPEVATTIRLVMTDTSHQSEDVNEEILVEKGVVEVTESHLANLTKGPVILEIYREEERPLTGKAGNWGKFMMTYGLRRHFNLVQ